MISLKKALRRLLIPKHIPIGQHEHYLVRIDEKIEKEKEDGLHEQDKHV